MATSNFYSKFWLQAIDMILYPLLISAIIVAPSSVISSPVKLDPQSHTLPDVNVPTSGQYDKSDTYRTDGNPWIVHLLPEQPTYLRSCLETIHSCQTIQHNSGHGNINPSFVCARQPFVTFTETPRVIKPAKGAFHNPSSW